MTFDSPWPLRKVPDQDLATLSRQLGVMLEAGIPLLAALQEIGEASSNPALGEALRAIRGDLEAGSSLSRALRAQPHTFDRLFANLVAAGEACGELDRAFLELARFLEKRIRIRRIAVGASLYPVSILLVAGIVLVCMLVWVIPVFTELFANLGVPLPLPTRLILDASRILQDSVYLFGLGGLTGGLLVRQICRTGPVRRQLDHWLLAAPLLGKLARKVIIARFSATLAALLKAGIPILPGLKMTAGTVGNCAFRGAVEQGIRAVEQGEPLAGSLARSTLFPALVLQLVQAGERSGQLERMFSSIAEYSELEAEVAVTALLKLMEPICIVLAGGVVGGIVVSLYLPVFSLAGRLSQSY